MSMPVILYITARSSYLNVKKFTLKRWATQAYYLFLTRFQLSSTVIGDFYLLAFYATERDRLIGKILFNTSKK